MFIVIYIYVFENVYFLQSLIYYKIIYYDESFSTYQ